MSRDLLAILDARLDSLESAVLHRFLERQRSEHPSEGKPLGDYLDLLWAWEAWQDRHEYARDPAAWELAHPRPREVLDWRAVALEEVHAWLETQLAGFREGEEARGLDPRKITLDRMELCEPWMAYLPDAFDPARIPWVAQCPPLLEVREDLQELLEAPEFEGLRKHATFQVAFNVRPKNSHGRRVLGSLKPLGKITRLEWPSWPAPLFRLQLDWQYWAAMGTWAGPRGRRELRYRLLHHELGHARIIEREDKPPQAKSRPHDLEEQASTAERYGASTLAEAVHYERALLHPRTQALLEQVPAQSRTFLRTSTVEVGSARVGRPTAAGWRSEIEGLRRRITEAQRGTAAVDYGAAPWAEVEAQLDALEASEPTAEAQLQLEICGGLVARWAPRRSA